MTDSCQVINRHPIIKSKLIDSETKATGKSGKASKPVNSKITFSHVIVSKSHFKTFIFANREFGLNHEVSEQIVYQSILFDIRLGKGSSKEKDSSISYGFSYNRFHLLRWCAKIPIRKGKCFNLILPEA